VRNRHSEPDGAGKVPADRDSEPNGGWSVDDRGLGTKRLARGLGLGDAVVVGLGSMLGAGVFASFAPAAAAAGAGLLIALALAAMVAYCNGLATAQLAARYPESGGAYRYGRLRLGPVWGFLAGWGFVIGKTASCAAMALTFGAYTSPEHPSVPAVAAVMVLTAVNYLGSPGLPA
jgi:APA family basic amino acid/polyamine antiporter